MATAVNFPALVDVSLTERKNLCADDVMTFGHYDAAVIQKKKGLCFSLCYFTMFGRMPRKLKAVQSSAKRSFFN